MHPHLIIEQFLERATGSFRQDMECYRGGAQTQDRIYLPVQFKEPGGGEIRTPGAFVVALNVFALWQFKHCQLTTQASVVFQPGITAHGAKTGLWIGEARCQANACPAADA